MTLTLQVSHVDGVSCHTLHTPRIDDAMEFAKHYDHEGAAITLTVQTFDEGVYDVLNALKEFTK